jgi:hypothetical protein
MCQEQARVRRHRRQTKIGEAEIERQGPLSQSPPEYWARTIFVTMLQRRARLAGIELAEVWGGYSATIGNLAFEARDACAAAAEIARRGITRLAGMKDVLPAFGERTVASLRKDLPLPVDAGNWAGVHRTINAAKIGYRRPHHDVPQGRRDSDVHGTLASHGHAVVSLRRRHRPGLLFRAAPARPDEAVRDFNRSTWKSASRIRFQIKIQIAERPDCSPTGSPNASAARLHAGC